MWKPGTSGPPRSKASPPKGPKGKKRSPLHKKGNANLAKGGKKASPAAAATTPTGGVAKKLSGATLGMRFMQRNAEAKAAAEKKRRAEEEAETPPMPVEAMQRKKSSDRDNDHDDEDEGGGSMVTDHNAEDDALDQRAPQAPLPASDADMYGVETDIVGRRSFGGFNKPVGETWAAALRLRQKNKAAEAGVGKKAVSDEELIRRYEKHARGRDDGPDLQKSESSPIGNLSDKVRKKNKNQRSGRSGFGSCHGSGQKRRRR